MVHYLENQKDLEEFVEKFDNFLFDCDGVIWHGDQLIKGVAQVMSYLRGKNKSLIFVTNNATKSREEFKSKFDRLGIQADLNEIYGSAYATALYLKRILKFPDDKKAFVIGEKGLEDELKNQNIRFCGGTDPDENVFIDLMDFSSIKSDAEVGAVVCGFDMHINYKKLAKAHRYLNENNGCHFVLTNDDSTFPTDGSIFPGSGSISAPLRYALLGKIDPVVVGKPNKPMLDCIMEKHNLNKAKTCMIGDRLDTDIAFGNNGGLSTLLVLTGVVIKSDVDKADLEAKPTYVIESLGDLERVVK
ncbi:4-nitrophenylphosphatase [Phakopsora pachyrhizi]|uniref:4-nitrophenylphosphatase n=1 Tax=Phakopsora pachyrhizi TaxID=170000 RepID=A0AAV0AW36_PHAPC|nr:4-nitrophenylphosphatase [Phakopsora pachyrhizi]CAH7674312.1 4-nitrophenylphosphatase [Phakopsora pachyrhizi]